MKTDTLKKSLLDYAIKGRLSAKFRRENSELNAFDEISTYNDEIKQKRKELEKELKTLESKLKKAPTRHCETSAESISVIAMERSDRSNPQNKQELKSQIQSLKKEIAKCKEIIPLMTMDCHEVANATSRNDDLGYSSSSLRGEAEANHTPKTANGLPQVSSETLAMTTTPPFEIPSTWAWVKLGDICEIFTGDSINATEKEKNFTHQTSGLNYIATKDLANDTSITYENGIKIPDEFLPSFKIAKANSTLLCIEGGSAGRKVGFLKENVCFGNKLCCFENIFAFSKFVFYFLQSGEFSKEFNSNINGIIGGVKKESIRHFLIPLPPLREQQEIVKKLDLLVSLANDFAIIKENLKRIEKRIEKSLLKLALEGSLSKRYRHTHQSLSAHTEIQNHNKAIKEKRKNLEKELKTLESKLKKALTRHCETSAGGRGKTKHDPHAVIARERSDRSNPQTMQNPQTKHELKSQIQSLKKELAKCKEIIPLMTMDSKETSANAERYPLFCHEAANATSHNDDLESTLPVIARERSDRSNPHTPPFKIPSTWAWVKLGDICEINPKNDISDNVEISFIPMALIADSCQNTFTYELKLWKEVKGGFTHLCDNSVAFAKISPCFENGKSFVVKNLKNGYGAGTTELIVLLPYNPLLKEYVFYCVNSAFFVNQALKTFKGTAGQQRLNMDFVENFTIPLPPLKEQEHITQILDTLFTLKKGLRVE